MLKIKDLQNKEEKELLKLISEFKGKLLALRFENAAGSLKESHLIKETKKDVAKIFTVLRQKQKVVFENTKKLEANTKAEAAKTKAKPKGKKNLNPKRVSLRVSKKKLKKDGVK